MSVRCITWAWDQPIAIPSRKLVLLALADHAGDDGMCFPSSGRIAVKTGMSDGSVRRHIDALVADGLIVKSNRRRRKDGTLGTWEYQLLIQQPVDNDQRALVTSGYPARKPARTRARTEPSCRTVSSPQTPQREIRHYDVEPLTPEQIAEKYGCEA